MNAFVHSLWGKHWKGKDTKKGIFNPIMFEEDKFNKPILIVIPLVSLTSSKWTFIHFEEGWEGNVTVGFNFRLCAPPQGSFTLYKKIIMSTSRVNWQHSATTRHSRASPILSHTLHWSLSTQCVNGHFPVRRKMFTPFFDQYNLLWRAEHKSELSKYLFASAIFGRTVRLAKQY